MLSLYEQFQKENSSQISKLEMQNTKQHIHDFNSQFNCNSLGILSEDNIVKESKIVTNQFEINKSCINIDTEYKLNNHCIGYECDKQSFYHQPEKRNTYHNYLVLNDKNDAVCTKNHQYFNNWTKRNNEGSPFITQNNNIPPHIIPNNDIHEIKLYECNI